jgi:OOP family OmpA-OmpF porin
VLYALILFSLLSKTSHMRLIFIYTLFIYCSNLVLVNAHDFTVRNLGVNINTSYAETKPIIYPDGQTLYFARQNYPANYSSSSDEQDIYVRYKVNGKWQKASNIGAPLNDKHANGIRAIVEDGKAALALNAYNKYGDLLDGASISRKSGNTRSSPQMINIQEFCNENEYIDYFLANNERTLLLAIEQEDTYGDQDLYVSFWIDNGNWSKPVNLGRTINSPSPEFSPFLAADDKTLFFASYRIGGFGDSDIDYSKRLHNTWTSWSTPENLGEGVITKAFEAYCTIAASGTDAYFVTTKGAIDDSKNIFQMVLPYKFRPDPVLLLSGKVVNEANMQSLVSTIELTNLTAIDESLQIASIVSSGYTSLLPKGAVFLYVAVKEGFIGVLNFKDLSKLGVYQELDETLSLVPISTGAKVPAHQITFVKAKAVFSPDAYFELDRFAALLASYPAMQLKVTAHTANADQNNTLSTARAQAIADYFTGKGVLEGRLILAGVGNSIPFTNTVKPSLKPGTDSNERATFEIVSMNWEKPAPLDTDGDGVIAVEDDCAGLAGVPENRGCPEITQETKEVLKEALAGIEFESARDIIRLRSFIILDKVVQVMLDNPAYFLNITGHTDSQGDDDVNLVLSYKRAKATEKYLVGMV